MCTLTNPVVEESSRFRQPVTLAGAVATAAGECGAHAEEARRALAQRKIGRAFEQLLRMRHVLYGHLLWEAKDLPQMMDTPELLDIMGDSRPVRAWHDLLVDGVSDLVTELVELHDARGRELSKVDHGLARLQALIEDYRVDMERSVYRPMDEDVEQHDLEVARTRALAAWFRRIH